MGNIFLYHLILTAGNVAADLIEGHVVIFSLLLAFLGYWQTKAMNENNNAPAVIPVDIDLENYTIRLHNHGKSIAQNVQLSGYRHLMDWEELGDGRLDVWKLSFPPIGFLAPNESTAVPIHGDEGRMVFNLLFSRYKTPVNIASDNQKKPVPLLVSFQNLNGKHFRTSVNVVPGAYTSAQFGEDYWTKRKARDLFEYLKSLCIGPLYLLKKKLKISKKKG